MLERAYVFRQLDAASRFSRFGAEDMSLPIGLLILSTFASLAFDFHALYSAAVFAASVAATWLLRITMEEPPMTLIFYLVAPKHYSQHAADRQIRPYPPSSLN
ncbi:hypothetical protein NVS55_40165 (plasmid) [Myxococcus stipitatus]|uniref:hypothetical protein n=1 Tax=Myxococcus stipitatus TaxID=83455 RepID=UPI0031452236